MSQDTTIIDIARLDCALIEEPWSFAVDEAERIEKHWQARLAETPEMFNGRVLVLRHGAIETAPDGASVFRGACIEVEFKAFLAWREFGYPASGVRNCFAMAAIETVDGAFVLGEMAPHTATAGQIYFPAGTPDRHDVFGTTVDIEGSAQRELLEETGLVAPDVTFAPGLTLIGDPSRVCGMKRVLSPLPAEALVARITAWLSQDPKPELARMHIVRGPADLSPTMPPFVTAYLRHRFAGR